MALDVKESVRYAKVWTAHSDLADSTTNGYVGVEVFGDVPTPKELYNFLVKNNYIPLEFNGGGYDHHQTYNTGISLYLNYTEEMNVYNDYRKEKLLQVKYDKKTNEFIVENSMEAIIDVRYNKEAKRRIKEKKEKDLIEKRKRYLKEVEEQVFNLSTEEKKELQEYIIGLL